MKTLSTDKTRNVLLVARAGELLPDALSAALEEEKVSCGWMRASGVLRDVELRAHSPELGGLAKSRRIVGPVQVLSLEGSIGLSQGEISFGTRAVLARETDRGLEVLAGEIIQATIVALEVHVTALDEVAMPRALDREAGVWLLDASGVGTERSVGREFEEAPPTQSAKHEARGTSVSSAGSSSVASSVSSASSSSSVSSASSSAAPAAPSAWGDAIAASASTDVQRRAGGSGGASANPSPARPMRVQAAPDETPFPESGDVVQHFAFGRADVIKSDGDRLHLRVHKDGRIREIALQMLKVSELGVTTEGKRSFRLDRRL
jgi:predicted DNA-binding protein with PD1-like motif